MNDAPRPTDPSSDMNALIQGILKAAYALAPARLQDAARAVGATDWDDLTGGLTFSGQDTGGGCLMMVASLPGGYLLGVTDGEAGWPTDEGTFWVGVSDEESGDELAWVFSTGDQGGSLAGDR